MHELRTKTLAALRKDSKTYPKMFAQTPDQPPKQVSCTTAAQQEARQRHSKLHRIAAYVRGGSTLLQSTPDVRPEPKPPDQHLTPQPQHHDPARLWPGSPPPPTPQNLIRPPPYDIILDNRNYNHRATDVQGKQYRAHQINEDGNCLFSAFSKAGIFETHTQARKEACDYINTHIQDFSENDIIDALSDNAFQNSTPSNLHHSMEAYTQYMRQGGHFGTSLEIKALVQLTKIHVAVYTITQYTNQDNSPIVATYDAHNFFPSATPEYNTSILLLFRTSSSGCPHYDLLTESDTTNEDTTEPREAHWDRCISIDDFESSPIQPTPPPATSPQYH